LLPVVITITAILGMLSMTGFQLNVMTANLSAISVGVGIDYSIILSTAFIISEIRGRD
jgi:predicted RND superfamily exporter protein